MKLCVFVIAAAFLSSVQGVTYRLKDCIRVDVEGSITISGTGNDTSEVFNRTVELAAVEGSSITGLCANETTTSASMRVSFSDDLAWILVFSVGKDDRVELDQMILFNPSKLLNSTLPDEEVSLADDGNTSLSLRNASYMCNAERTITFTQNLTFTASQTIRNLQVQAFGLDNGSYSGVVEDCAADNSSTTEPPTAPTTEPTSAPVAPTLPVPTVQPTPPLTFLVNNSDNVPCFRLEAGLQFAVEYNTTNNTMVFSKAIAVGADAGVTGNCSNDTASMLIIGSDYELEIIETRSADSASSTIRLNVTLYPGNFPDAANANGTLVFERTETFQQSQVDTFYLCNTEQTLSFTNSRTVLYADQVRLQAFNLDNGSFTGDGEECSLDPTPAPSTPAPSPSDNSYAVKDTDRNITCIVLKGDLSFSNISYTKSDNTTVTIDPVNIPAFNSSSGEVNVSGSCAYQGNNNTQQLVISFYGNWTLKMTFAKGGSQDTAMLGAEQNEYSVRDIELTYYLSTEFFPNASDAGAMRTASQTNITDDLWKAQVGGGSYKCDADINQPLSNGVELDTSNLQYKAFNDNNDETFSGDNVSECPSDDESNSIVPIAVGAALAGLVVIVLIAYLIGRRRSRRQGYESV